MQLAKELLLPLAKDEQRKHKLKRLVQVSRCICVRKKTVGLSFYPISWVLLSPYMFTVNLWKLIHFDNFLFSTQTPTSWMWNAQAATGSQRWVLFASEKAPFSFIIFDHQLSLEALERIIAGVLSRADCCRLLGMLHRPLPVHWGQGQAHWRLASGLRCGWEKMRMAMGEEWE